MFELSRNNLYGTSVAKLVERRVVIPPLLHWNPSTLRMNLDMIVTLSKLNLDLSENQLIQIAALEPYKKGEMLNLWNAPQFFGVNIILLEENNKYVAWDLANYAYGIDLARYNRYTPIEQHIYRMMCKLIPFHDVSMDIEYGMYDFYFSERADEFIDDQDLAFKIFGNDIHELDPELFKKTIDKAEDKMVKDELMSILDQYYAFMRAIEFYGSLSKTTMLPIEQCRKYSNDLSIDTDLRLFLRFYEEHKPLTEKYHLLNKYSERNVQFTDELEGFFAHIWEVTDEDECPPYSEQELWQLPLKEQIELIVNFRDFAANIYF